MYVQNVDNHHYKKKVATKSTLQYTNALNTPVNLALTFAGLYALKPAVLIFDVAKTSAILIPSTARSATTDSAGFRERAAV